MTDSADNHRPVVLSAGTTDPWAAAGTQLDLFIADRLGVRLVNCILAVSAQDGIGTLTIAAMEQSLVEAQLASLARAPIAAMRIGAMHTEEHVDTLTAYARRQQIPIILDPVIATSAGKRFINESVLKIMKTRLFPEVTLVTPNLYEAEQLLGISIQNVAEMETAARRIAKGGSLAVLIKGGHLSGAPTDVLWDGTSIHRLAATQRMHDMRGTGCILAIACAAALAYGKTLYDAVQYARDIVQVYIRSSRDVGAMRVTR